MYYPEISSIKKNVATGYIDSNVIESSILQRLGINPSVQDRVEFEVEFTVNWDDDQPLVYIDALYIKHNDMFEQENLLDTLELEQEIEKKGDVSSWRLNRAEPCMDPEDDYYFEEN